MIKDLIEERVKEIENVDNKSTLRRILTNLFKKADKGSRAFWELQDKWGFTADYNETDWGNEPNNN